MHYLETREWRAVQAAAPSSISFADTFPLLVREMDTFRACLA